MKNTFLLAVALLIASEAAFADITVYNQPWGGRAFICDQNNSRCLPLPEFPNGITVYDDFIVPNGVTKLTGFTYVDGVYLGSWSDYISTNWTVFRLERAQSIRDAYVFRYGCRGGDKPRGYIYHLVHHWS